MKSNQETNKLVKILTLFCSSGLLLLFLFPLLAEASFAKQINYQGRIADKDGAPVVDGNYNLSFRLYGAPNGGVALWSETQTVTFKNGSFSVMLGSVVSLVNINFNQALYLSLEVNSDGEMLPRKVLGAVPSAFTAEKFDGLATTSFLRADLSNATATIDNLSSNYLSVTGHLNATGNISVIGDYAYRYNGVNMMYGSSTIHSYFFADAGNASSTGGWNMGFGQQALLVNTTGANNVAIGGKALASNLSGYSNVAIGSSALYRNTAGFNNVAIGLESMYNNLSGSNNIAFGYRALYHGSSTGNTAFGFQAGYGTTTSESMYNQLFGYQSGFKLQTGNNNNLFGYQSGFNLSTGNDNVFIGNKSGFLLTTGSDNILFGNSAGYNLVNGSGNILIGKNVQATSSNSSNFLNIGNALYGNLTTGNIGIGTTTPQTKLTVVGTSTFWGDVSIKSGLLDSAGSYGSYGQVLMSQGNSTLWVSTTTLAMLGSDIIGGGSNWLVGDGFLTPSSTLSVLISGGDEVALYASSSFVGALFESGLSFADSGPYLGSLFDLSEIPDGIGLISLGSTTGNLMVGTVGSVSVGSNLGGAFLSGVDSISPLSDFSIYEGVGLLTIGSSTGSYSAGATGGVFVGGSSSYVDSIGFNYSGLDGIGVASLGESVGGYFSGGAVGILAMPQVSSGGIGGMFLTSGSSSRALGALVSGTSSIGFSIETLNPFSLGSIDFSGDTSPGKIGINIDGRFATGLYINNRNASDYAIMATSGLNYFGGDSTFGGNIVINRGLLDSLGSYGSYGQVLMSSGTSTLWVSTSTLGIVGGEIGGGSSQWSDSGGDIYYTSGNVGVGTISPTAKLQVSSGDVLFEGAESVYTVDAPNNPIFNLHYNPTTDYGYYPFLANGSTQTYHIYSYRDINGEKVFSSDYLEVEVTDNNSGEYYYVEISWDAVSGVSGYLAIKPELPYGRYDETSTNNIEDHFWNSAMSEDSLTPKSPYAVEPGVGLFFDSSNTRIGIGTITPITKLHVEGDGGILAAGEYGFGLGTSWDGGELGAGTRMMWVPSKAAFRAGFLHQWSDYGGTEWDSANIGDYSFAGGYNTIATGSASFAFGSGALAVNSYAIALGLGVISSGWGSVAMGENSLASSNNAFAMGYGTTASYDQAVAMGDRTTASGLASFAMGREAVASGYYSTAFGYQTLSSGWNSTALGDRTEASGDSSFVSGYRSIASGTNAFAHGYYSFATGGEAIALGAMITVSGDNSIGIGLDRNAGIGTIDITRNNTMAIMGGNVGIGTTTPETILSIVGTGSLFGDWRLSSQASAGNYFTLKSAPGLNQNLAWTLPTDNGGLNKYLTSDNSGNLSWADLPTNIGSTTFEYLGTVYTFSEDANFSTQNTTRYLAAAGGAIASSDVVRIIITRAGKLKNLQVKANSNAFSGTVTFRVTKNGVDTDLSAVFTGSGVFVASNTTTTVEVAPGDVLALKMVTSAGSGIIAAPTAASFEHLVYGNIYTAWLESATTTGIYFDTGNVGIGTSTPENSRLFVSGTSTFWGDVLISSLDINGAVYSNDGVLSNVAPSSQDYKNTITPVDLNLDALLGLQVKSFNWNNNGQADFGLIAEEIRDVLPELYMDNGKIKGYRADHLPFYLLQIAQRQNRQIQELDTRLNNGQLVTVATSTQLTNIASIISASGNWSIGDDGTLVVKNLRTDNLFVETGVTIRDRATGAYSCLYIENGSIKSSLGECADTLLTSPSIGGGGEVPPISSALPADDIEEEPEDTSTSTSPESQGDILEEEEEETPALPPASPPSPEE